MVAVSWRNIYGLNNIHINNVQCNIPGADSKLESLLWSSPGSDHVRMIHIGTVIGSQ